MDSEQMDSDGKIASYLLAKKKKWEDDTDEMRKQWKYYYRVWKCKADPKDKNRSSELSQIKMPNTKLAIDSAYNNVQEMTFAREPFYEIKPTAEQYRGNGKRLGKYMDMLFREQGFEGRYGKMSLERFILGTAIGMTEVVPMSREKESIADAQAPATVPLTAEEGMPGEIAEAIQEIESGREYEREFVIEETEITVPAFSHVPLRDFIIDSSATSIDDAEGMFVRRPKSLHSLRKLQKKKVLANVDMLEKLVNGDMNEARKEALNERGISIDKLDEHNIEVYEYWGWINEEELKDAGYRGEIECGGAEVRAIFANDVTLMLMPNPHVSKKRPFVRCVYQEVPGQFYGLGIPEATDSAQRAIDATVRSRIDSKAFSNFPEYEIVAEDVVPGQDWTVRNPGQNRFVKRAGAIRPLTTPDTSVGSHLDVQEYGNYVQEGAGVSKMRAGIPVKRGEQSATEASILNAQSSAMLKAIARADEEKVIIPVLRWYYHITLQFTEEQNSVEITDKEGNVEDAISVTPDSILGSYRFMPIGTTEIAQRAELERLIQMFQMSMSSPVAQQIVNIKYLAEKIFDRLFPNATDKEKIFVPELDQRMAAQNAQGIRGVASQPRTPGVPGGVAG